MAEYMVLFRLPLSRESKLACALRSMGWQSINDNVYCRTLEASQDDVITHVKTLCRENSDVDNGLRNSAFTVIRLPRRAAAMSASR